MVLTSQDILNKLNNVRPELMNRFAIIRMSLFGSYSKGTMTEMSDIDLLYEIRHDKRLDYKEVYELEEYLSSLFDGRKTDAVNIKYLNPVVASQIKEAIIDVWHS